MWIMYKIDSFEIVQRYSDECGKELECIADLPLLRNPKCFLPPVRLIKIPDGTEEEWKMWQILNKKENK